ncbi:MAG TPA: ABC transporter substrate-binding protein [Micromonosporaceae bacterium]|nr:ABC transporter substrate-binding protein [Micromonosporaceae bacterium]
MGRSAPARVRGGVARPRRLRAVIALAAVTAVTLAGCGRSDTGTAPAAPASEGAPIVIAASFDQSGPLAATQFLGRGVSAYLAKVNADGGLNGRQVKYVQYDDAYDPSRLTANARRAVEQDRASIFISFGGPSLAIRPYLNQNKVLHLVFAGNTPFSDVAQFPYTHAWWPDIAWESAIDAAYLKQSQPGVKLGILGYNNDLTDSQVAGVKAGGLEPASVLRVPPSQLDTTSQVTQLKAAGVDAVLLSVGNGQVISTVKYMNQIGYTPKTFIYSTAAGRLATIDAITPAAAKGIYTTLWLTDPGDPKATGDTALAGYFDDVKKYGNGADPGDSLVLQGYTAAAALANAVKTASAQNPDAYNAAWNATKDLKVPGLLPGTSLSAGSHGRLVHQYQIVQFDGTAWAPVGGVEDATSKGFAK